MPSVRCGGRREVSNECIASVTLFFMSSTSFTRRPKLRWHLFPQLPEPVSECLTPGVMELLLLPARIPTHTDLLLHTELLLLPARIPMHTYTVPGPSIAPVTWLNVLLLLVSPECSCRADESATEAVRWLDGLAANIMADGRAGTKRLEYVEAATTCLPTQAATLRSIGLATISMLA